MRLTTRDQLTAMARFVDDCSGAMRTEQRKLGMRRIKAALRLWGAAPSESTWEYFTNVVRDELGEELASSLLADFEPYVR